MHTSQQAGYRIIFGGRRHAAPSTEEAPTSAADRCFGSTSSPLSRTKTRRRRGGPRSSERKPALRCAPAVQVDFRLAVGSPAHAAHTGGECLLPSLNLRDSVLLRFCAHVREGRAVVLFVVVDVDAILVATAVVDIELSILLWVRAKIGARHSDKAIKPLTTPVLCSNW